MSSTLYLVRHGDTEWRAENRYAGVSDIALTDAGRDQAERLGRWAAGERVDAVWASPLNRARATAAPAASALHRPILIDGGLTELDFGSAEGRTLAELPPADVEAFLADPVHGAFPGAEDPRKAVERGTAALRRAASRHRGERVLIVAHDTLLRLTLCGLLGIDPSRYRTVFPRVRACAVTELAVTAQSAALMSYNAPIS
ncbi:MULTISPECIES: histidine phosphatase family protein [Actinomadura]|uniref:histidine phosphatase family protein n=1 Tax=Actinomadura TaxID=1988 RepID=UPI0003FC8259|nr:MULTISPECIES: histidine phosphatase family protein [Actinomadura]RSN71959.1 histidine phosphatase family protein [Actinomadura sp. WAC 06369]